MSFDIWINAFLAFFAILNPIGNIPVFSEFTDDLDKRTRFKVFNVAVFTGFSTLFIMTMTGRWIMSTVFQIDIIEFRIAGGILLTVLAVKYIVFPKHKEQHDTDISEENAMETAIVPMAIPLLVGPGSIITGILILDRDGYVVTISALLAVFAVCWILFQLSPLINRMLGKVGKLVLSRILWVFIAAIGVHFLVSGIKLSFGIN